MKMDPKEWCMSPKDFIGKSYSHIDESIRSIFPSLFEGDEDSVIFVLQNQSQVIAIHPSSFMLYIGESVCSVSNESTLLAVLSVSMFIFRNP